MPIEEMIQQELVQKMARFPDVAKIVLFGSRATGEAKRFSDIDLAIFGVNDDQVWSTLRQIADNARTLLKIDLLRFEQVNTAMQSSILREGKTLYERTTDETGHSMLP